jgi:CHASE2 domain-containing sensor protein
MNKLVILSLGNSNLHSGFPAVTAQLLEGDSAVTKSTGSLPAAPEIAELYKYWQLLYSALYQRLDLCPRIEIDAADVTNVSEVDFSDLCQRLSDRINIWLNSESFRHIDQQLRTQLDCSEEIRIIIETNDNLLRRLPWHLWNFFEHYPKAEVALSAPEYKRPHKSLIKTPGAKVRILAILGNGKGINLAKDRAFLEQLSEQAETKFVEPQLEKLNDQLWEQGWDILFFAGHSSSQEKGLIQLDQTNSVTLDKLKYALSKAIERGLKLAIFNSCDGLGLAQDLADLNIPQVIVMREPVPDVVAQEFLRHFLAAFSSGQSLYAAVREARERLQTLEGKYPCATWLPVICQNPAEVPTTWKEWCGSTKGDRSFLPSKCRLRTVLLASVVVTALVMGVRQLGMLQTWELQAFDQSLRLRPHEGQDPRLLVVTVTEADVQKQKLKERRSLSDAALAQLLKKLQPYQPQVIGLDIYRDFPVDPKQADLETYLQDEHFIAVCEVGGENDYPGVGPPPGIPEKRLSFSDVPVDPDKVVRRQLLGMAPDRKSFCATDISFSFRVALTYLAAKGIQYKFTPEGNLQIGSVVFKRLEADTGGYQQLNALGYQVLLNYRSSDSVAQQVPLYDILSGSLDAELPNLVKERIVLIGTTAKSFKDYFPTPYSAGHWSGELPGVVIHAHMVSQILSAVLDERPLLWWFPAWGEMLWIWGWSLVGGVLVWRWRSPLHLGLASSAALGTLYGICFILLLKGGWVPLVPSALALVATGGSVVAYTVSQTRQQS